MSHYKPISNRARATRDMNLALGTLERAKANLSRVVKVFGEHGMDVAEIAAALETMHRFSSWIRSSEGRTRRVQAAHRSGAKEPDPQLDLPLDPSVPF